MKQKNKITIRDVLPLVASFFIPVMVMIIIFYQREIFPFGDSSFLRTDLYHQYAPFLSEFADKLQSGESLLYSWDIGGGTNFAALYSYYLASPLNWLLIIIPHKFVIEYLTYALVVKIGLCGLTMAIYLKLHNKTHDWGIAFVAIFYALSGYIAAYSWNIMWMDCILLFPLIMLGVERLVRENRPFLYCITLALSILSNYYISIMICIFMVVYFISLLITLPHTEQITGYNEYGVKCVRKRFPNYFRPIFHFALYSLLAGGLAALTLLPEIYALGLTASSDSTFPKTLTVYFPIFDMIARHMMTVDVHLKLEHWPNIYCGVAVFIFIPLYIMNRRIRYKEKFANLVLVTFLLVSFSFNMLNFIWHGFHYPNSLPCRQSFIYIFLILSMCYQGYMGLKDRSTKQIVGAAAFGIGFALIAEKLIDADNDEFYYYSFYLSILFIALYGLVAYLYRRRKVVTPVLVAATLILVSLESAINMTVTSVTTITRSTYLDMDESVSELKTMAQEKNPDLLFARYEKNELRTKNDGAWLDYPSISTFSSMSYDSLSDFYRSMGMESSTNAYGSNGMTGVIETLLGVRYIFYKDSASVEETDRYQLVGTSGEISLYENTDALSIAYMIPSQMKTNWNPNSYPIENQSSFIYKSTGVTDIFENIAMNPSGSTTTTTIEKSGYYYAYVISSSVENVEASHGNWSKSFKDLDRKYLINLGYCEAGEALCMSTTDDVTNLSVMTYRLDEDKLDEAAEILKSQELELEEFNSDSLKGTVTATEDGTMLTTIAYDPGWTVYVDGEKVEYEAFADTYICFDLTAGTHTVEMKFEPQGLRYGIILSALSLLLFLLLFILTRKLRDDSISIEYIDEPYPVKWMRRVSNDWQDIYDSITEDKDGDGSGQTEKLKPIKPLSLLDPAMPDPDEEDDEDDDFEDVSLEEDTAEDAEVTDIAEEPMDTENGAQADAEEIPAEATEETPAEFPSETMNTETTEEPEPQGSADTEAEPADKPDNQ